MRRTNAEKREVKMCVALFIVGMRASGRAGERAESTPGGGCGGSSSSRSLLDYGRRDSSLDTATNVLLSAEPYGDEWQL